MNQQKNVAKFMTTFFNMTGLLECENTLLLTSGATHLPHLCEKMAVAVLGL